MNEDITPRPVCGELAELFRHVARLMVRCGHGRQHGRHAQSRVLRLLRERGPLRQGELLGMLDVRSASLSELLAKLERTGRIARERDDRDRRGFVVRAIDRPAGPDTATGDGVEDGAADADGAAFTVLSDEECAQLRGLLLKLSASLEANPFCAGPRGGRGPHLDDEPCHLGSGRGRGCGHGRHGGRGGADQL